jgi:hypothetical protein
MSQQSQSAANEGLSQRTLDLVNALEAVARKIAAGEIKADGICVLFVTVPTEEGAEGKFAINSYINGIDPSFTPLVLQAAADGFKSMLYVG